MPDGSLFLFHLAFWCAFAPRVLAARRDPAPPPPGGADDEPRCALRPALRAGAHAAPGARLLLTLHSAAFFVLYFGIGAAMRGPHEAAAPLARELAGGAIILAGGVLILWCMRVFHSWRLQAKIDAGHRLSTDGPFRFVRHPIYLALDLLALGSAVWLATPLVIAVALLIALGGDLRGRAEEKVLTLAFADDYRDYASRVKRFVPGVY
jgi:protein-S-isoprenylcysteine O-methyltransferase Ste14